MSRTIRHYIDLQATARPGGGCLLAPEPRLTLTFAGLRAASRRLSCYLLARGLQPGARIALLMPNGDQTCRLFVGAMDGGFCVTPLNLLAQHAQLAYVLEHSAAAIVFVSPCQRERLEAAVAGPAGPLAVVVCDVDSVEFIGDADAGLPAVGEEDDALMMYTSGTTGHPKGVVLANRSVVAGGQFVSAAHGLGPADRVMASRAMYHINPRSSPPPRRWRMAAVWCCRTAPASPPSGKRSRGTAAPGSTWCRP